MIRWKTALLLVLSAGLLILGGMLPGIVGDLQDDRSAGKVGYVEIPQIHLEFDNDGMSLREKLGLLSGMTNTMQVSQEMTKHTSAEIWQIAMETSEKYRQAGLVTRALSPADIAYCVPMMAYWESYEGATQIRSNIFWELSIADGASGENALNMMIDDRTGTVCTISYQNVTAQREQLNLVKSLELLCDMALEELGEEFLEFDPRQMVQAAGITEGSSYAAADVAWEDPTFGEIRLAFVVSDVGFYTYTY